MKSNIYETLTLLKELVQMQLLLIMQIILDKIIK